ncbi:MAG TPA: CehA/McbA family metallohydrolase, partial [Candidatus Hydrogenedentes bacterium]|nr:CehA/McbA family metallohydrolase [Candidatus Hydrogenedentota bacterium]
GWYKGDLHVRSVHGGGVESVAELVARAEKSGLDFIAITDRNTLESVYDANFHSNKVVLIPAMEWGDDERGVALIYGPRTLPAKPSGFKDDQGVCQRVQAQGGIFAIAHPCLDKAPWQRGLGFVNAVQVWCRDWRAMPGITLNSLMDEYQRRVDDNLVYSISLAANTQNLSANGQAAMFWDYELTRGLKAAAIAGSMSANPKVPLGQPMTWVYAQEKSARGILHGLRLGRTMVTAGPDAPFIEFLADANTSKRTINVDLEKGIKKEAVNVNRPDVGLGGVVPLGINVNLMVQVKNANGAKVEILRNGWPIISKKIETDKVDVLQVTERPSSYAVYRARVIRAPQGPGVGPIDILAMTSPIYAQDIIPIDPTKKDPLDVWVKVGNSGLPPAKVSERIEEGGQTRVRFEQGAPIPPVEQDTFEVPQGERVVELKPKPL